MKKFQVKREQAEMALAGIGLYNAARSIVSQFDGWRYERGYIVSVASDDEAFVAVGRAVLKLMPDQRRRRIQARTERNFQGPTEVIAAYEATKPETIVIGGYKVRVSIERGAGRRGAGADDVALSSSLAAAMRSMQPDRLTLWTSHGEAANAIMAFIQEAVMVSRQEKTGPKLWVASSWGEWSNFDDAQCRDLETVVLPDGKREALVDDLKFFLAQEANYVRLGLPWHRGYLLYGPPGTGKTSLVRAIASHLGLDLYCVPLTDVRTDANLSSLLRSVKARSVLLFEDLDTAIAARDRDAEKPGVSTSGLLNALDGVATPHGLITFMTTNRRETLDPALLRAGRCDKQFKLDYLDDDQLRRLVEAMIGYAPDLPPVTGELAPSSVVELIKENITDDEAFLLALKERLTNGEQQG